MTETKNYKRLFLEIYSQHFKNRENNSFNSQKTKINPRRTRPLK